MTMMVLLLFSILESVAMYLSRSYPVPMCLEPLRRSYCVDGAAACATHWDALDTQVAARRTDRDSDSAAGFNVVQFRCAQLSANGRG